MDTRMQPILTSTSKRLIQQILKIDEVTICCVSLLTVVQGGWGGGAEAMAPPKVSSEPIFIKESQ